MHMAVGVTGRPHAYGSRRDGQAAGHMCMEVGMGIKCEQAASIWQQLWASSVSRLQAYGSSSRHQV